MTANTDLTLSVVVDGLELLCGPGAFTPQPETAAMTRWILEHADIPTGARVVDLCSGVGTAALLLARDRPDLSIDAVELDDAPIDYLRRNARTHFPALRVHQDDVAGCLPDLDGAVDLVISNPPYVADDELATLASTPAANDPALAVEGGSDGLRVIDRVQARAHRLLRPQGLLVIEHSTRQRDLICQLLSDEGWRALRAHDGLLGEPRFVTCRR